VSIRLALGRYLLVSVIAAGCGTPRDVTIRAAGIEPPLASTRKCAGPGGAYTVRYPASWFTVEHGSVPCRFFHPEPFTLPESTEAPGLAVRVVVAPAPFDVIVPPLHGQGAIDETLSRRNGFVARHRTARIDSRTRNAGILPAGTRQLTWYVETGEETLVATTSDNASSGRFGSNAEVLDAIVAALRFPPIASPGGALSDDEYNVVADAVETVAAQVLHDPIEHRAEVQRPDMLCRAGRQFEEVVARTPAAAGSRSANC
jgi:hypothetical protein